MLFIYLYHGYITSVLTYTRFKKVYLEDILLEEVDHFIYLGSYMDQEGDTNKAKSESQKQQCSLETLNKYGNQKY